MGWAADVGGSITRAVVLMTGPECLIIGDTVLATDAGGLITDLLSQPPILALLW